MGSTYVMGQSEVNDRHCDVALGLQWPDCILEGGSLNHDNVDGWTSGADNVDGWEFLTVEILKIFSDHE